jgi:hypothetical protein
MSTLAAITRATSAAVCLTDSGRWWWCDQEAALA